MAETKLDTPKPTHATLFASCMVDQVAPSVGEDAITVLEYLGVQVDFLSDQTCCGQPAFNSGFRSEAYPVAKRFIELFETVEHPIIVPSGSCAAMARNYYKDLFRDDSALADRAAKVGARIFELTEFVSKYFGTRAIEGRLEGSTTYHKCCHLLREIGVDEEPIEMLSNIDGVNFVPLERADVCCGFGGSFSVKMPDISTAILDEKLDFIEATGASTVVAADTGCVFQMQGGLRRRGSSVKVIHIAEALADSIRNSASGAQTR